MMTAYLASLLKLFLIRFQIEKAMVPFLATDLYRIMRQIHGIFMKRDVVKQGNTTYLLSQVDVSMKENDLSIDNLYLGSAVTSELAKLGVPAETNKIAI